MTGQREFRVGDWVVKPACNVLERGGDSRKLEPRAMDVLAYLASRPGEVVSAEQLIGSVWKGRLVGDGVVYHSVNQLRRALGEETNGSRFIETVPKRGYRLIAAVSSTRGEEQKRAISLFERGLLRRSVSIIAIVLVLSASVGTIYLPRNDTIPNSVAVLPFESLSPDPSNDFFAASLHEEVLSQLGIIHGLRPIARTSVLQYAGAARPITEIARELNAESIMEGSVAYGEGRVVVSVRLIDAVTGTRLWGDRYNKAFEDVFEIQQDIASNVVAALEAEFLPGEQQRIGQRPTASAAAYALYFQALSLPSDPRSAADLLDRAIGIDPRFGLAQAHKAFLYASDLRGVGRFARDRRDIITLARDAASRALEIDPTLGIAHTALATTSFVSGELAQARAEYERALEVSPNNSLVLALYSAFKRAIGEYDGAITLSERGVSRDPNNAFNVSQLALNHWSAGNYDAARAGLLRTIDLAPTDAGAHMGLARVEIVKGNETTALKELQFVEELLDPNFPALRLEQLAFAYSQLGREHDARRFHGMLMALAQQESVSEATIGLADLAIGEHERAFARLNKAVHSPSIGDQIVLGELKANPYGVPMLEQSPWRELRGGIGTL